MSRLFSAKNNAAWSTTPSKITLLVSQQWVPCLRSFAKTTLWIKSFCPPQRCSLTRHLLFNSCGSSGREGDEGRAGRWWIWRGWDGISHIFHGSCRIQERAMSAFGRDPCSARGAGGEESSAAGKSQKAWGGAGARPTQCPAPAQPRHKDKPTQQGSSSSLLLTGHHPPQLPNPEFS